MVLKDGEIHLKTQMTWFCLSSRSVSDALLGALETCTTVAEEFIKKCILDKSVDFHDSLSRSNLNTFKSMAAATKVKVNG